LLLVRAAFRQYWSSGQRRERAFLGTVMAGVAAELIFVGVRTPAGSTALAGIVAAVAGLAGALFLPALLPASLDGLSSRWPGRAFLVVLIGAGALVQTARLGIFMLDPARADCATVPFSAWQRDHSCLAVLDAASARADRGVPAYRAPGDQSADAELHGTGPSWLLVQMVLRLVAPGAQVRRALWFAVEGLALGLALFFLAARVRGPRAVTAFALLPLAWTTVPVMSALQLGSLQVVVVALALIAMGSFEDRHPALGGALLSFVTLTKLYPLVLVLHLLFRRRWRALAWTVVFAAVQLGVAVHVLGLAPFQSFLRDAVPHLTTTVQELSVPRLVAVNQAVSGVVLKVQLLGLPPPSYETRFFELVTVGYAALLVPLAWGSRRISSEAHRQALVWIALLLAGSLAGVWVEQSAGLLPAVLLAVLVVTAVGFRHAAVLLAALTWLAANVLLPPDPEVSPALLTAITLGQQSLAVLLGLWAFRRGLSGALSRALGVPGRTPSPEPARTYRRW
jgi:alpha-1,2-mannosyltransferase